MINKNTTLKELRNMASPVRHKNKTSEQNSYWIYSNLPLVIFLIMGFITILTDDMNLSKGLFYSVGLFLSLIISYLVFSIEKDFNRTFKLSFFDDDGEVVNT